MKLGFWEVSLGLNPINIINKNGFKRWRKLSALSALALMILISGCGKSSNDFVPPPPDVTLKHPVEQEVTTYLEHTGATAALESVEIRARVAGYLESIKYQPRAKVKAGDLLFVIDPRPYSAKVQQALGALNAQKAQLRIRQIELDKYTALGSKEAVAELKLEDTRAGRDMAEAELQRSKANLDSAKLDLEYTHVRSPINGRVSRNLVDVGNLVGVTGDTLLAQVVNDDSVYVYFNLTERELLSLNRKSIRADGESSPQSSQTPVYMGLADEVAYPHEGKLDYTDIKVDQSTGTIPVRAIFPNSKGLLYPGMFARVRVPVETKAEILIPDVAVMTDQGGKYALVCNDSNVAELRRVKVAQLVGDMRVVQKGLTPKDNVIVNGLQRTRPGGKVNPTNGVAQSASPSSADVKSAKD
jgi:multidrug efflux system membrane fusion protein